MTSFKTAESPFKSDSTASNKCGFTLMNNQVGAVIAQVMATKDNVTVTPLPSMIRVDAVGRMDVVYDEVAEALGEEAGVHAELGGEPLHRLARGACLAPLDLTDVLLREAVSREVGLGQPRGHAQ